MAVKDHMTEPMQLPVTYELDDNGEANGSAHPY